MILDIKSLDSFVKVADEKSISKVANQLYISQPALSLQIRKLEESFGHKLLIRTNKGVQLTDAGHILETHARSILKIYNQAFEEVNKLFGDRQVIRIDSNITLATYALPCAVYVAKSQPQFKDYYLDLTFSTVNPVEKNIISGISDLGYVHQKGEYQDIKYVKIGTDKMVLVAASNFPVPDRITVEELKQYHLIKLNDKFNERKLLSESLCCSLKEFNVVLALDSTESVKTAVFKEFGMSFLPESSVSKELQTRILKEVVVEDLYDEYPIYLCYLKENEYNPRLKPFLDYLKMRKTMDFC
ncbi:LysR family transcriptional regulator [Anoxybacterium hadale]|uniref:LysR family transcriptional regulator n=1 Tax=Anoxybacterium hadale TaxID=3408580 RepID=A0ACD1A6W8_9FIRM|nr:LysR family transcriptional regulator [Clostridiales bacterium]